MKEENIPKVIHYAWFGRGKKSETIKKCIESWRNILPDYKIIEWNEDNFDINKYKYVKEAYESKKYAYVSDVLRLYVLYNYGGIYMDTDVEVVKSLDCFLENEGFSGFESDKRIPTGIMAAKKNNRWIYEQLKVYDNITFLDENGKMNLTTNVEYITQLSLKIHGYIPNGKKQILKYGFVIYPFEYFCAKSLEDGNVKITKNTYTIHHFAGSWVPLKSKINRKIYRILLKIFGIKIANIFSNKK